MHRLLHIGIVLLLATSSGGCTQKWRARRLLSRGQYHEVLKRTRPGDAVTYQLRGRAWLALGNLDEAHTELLISLALDDGDAKTHRLFARLQRQLGNRGLEFAHLRRSVALDDDHAPSSKRLAVLLRRRAQLCADPRLALGCEALAQQDQKRAVLLDPRSTPIPPQWRTKTGASARAAAVGGTTDPCPGLPPREQLDALRPLPQPGCNLATASPLVQSAGQRYVLVGCNGAHVALVLERHGCLTHALQVWRKLAREAPAEERWPLQQARIELARQKLARAMLLLVDYRYLSSDRAGAGRQAAQLLLLAGHRKQAARFAVQAFGMAKTPRQQVEALRLIDRAGARKQARQAARLFLAQHGDSLDGDALREVQQLVTPR